MKARLVAKTDRGGRSQNQDAYCAEQTDDRVFAAVCDGLGAYAGSEYASERIACALKKWFYTGACTPESLEEELLRLHEDLVRYKSMLDRSRSAATTVCALYVDCSDGRGFFVSVGDTRLYRVGRKGTERLTEDDSLARELVKTGALKEDDVRSSPERRSLTAAVGSGRIRPRVARLVVSPGDRYVLCTDGVWEHVQDEEFSDSSPLERCMKKWFRKVRRRGGRCRDNATAVAAEWLR